MSSIDINNVLAQIRSLQPQTQIKPVVPEADPNAIGGVAKDAPGFGDLLRSGIDAVADRQQEAKGLQERFELGDPNVDLATVMLASSKAGVSFRGMVEVRNRLVSAYQDIMNMPI